MSKYETASTGDPELDYLLIRLRGGGSITTDEFQKYGNHPAVQQHIPRVGIGLGHGTSKFYGDASSSTGFKTSPYHRVSGGK